MVYPRFHGAPVPVLETPKLLRRGVLQRLQVRSPTCWFALRDSRRRMEDAFCTLISQSETAQATCSTPSAASHLLGSPVLMSDIQHIEKILTPTNVSMTTGRYGIQISNVCGTREVYKAGP